MKFIGVGVLAGCVTAAAAGYVALREPAPAVPPVAAEPKPEPRPEAAPVQEPVRLLTPPKSSAPPKPLAAPLGPVPAPVEPAEVVAPARIEIEQPVVPPAPAAAQPTSTSPSPPAPEPQRYVPDQAPMPPPAPVIEPTPQFDEVTIERNSVIGIRLDVAISSRTARVEDRISATVSRDVTVQGRVAIPDGAKLEGTVTAVDQGGKFRERPRLGLRFDTMILTDGTRLSIQTDTIFREGDSPSADATARVGAGAVAGTILGAVLGGKKGAAIGGVAGAAGGAATVMSGDGNETALREGAPLTVRLTDDLTVLVKKY